MLTLAPKVLFYYLQSILYPKIGRINQVNKSYIANKSDTRNS